MNKEVDWTSDPVPKLREALAQYADKGYARFMRSGLPKEVESPVMGVRVPIIKAIVKTIPRQDDEAFLRAILTPKRRLPKNAKPDALEERIAVACVLGRFRTNLDLKAELLDAYMPYIDSWAVCDELCAFVKPRREEKDEFWDYLERACASDAPYTVRFGLVETLKYYVERGWLARVLDRVERVAQRDLDVRTVNMALAWLVCEIMAKFPNDAFKYLENNSLNNFSYNLALSKIQDSLRVSDEIKEELKSMKR